MSHTRFLSVPTVTLIDLERRNDRPLVLFSLKW